MRPRAYLVAFVAFAALACGGGQTHPNLFANDWEDDGGATIESLRVRLAGKKPPPQADVAVGVAARSDKLVGVPLDGGPKWSFAHAVDWRPVVTGSVVVAAGGHEVVALDARTGQKLWARDTGGLPLRGAGDDGAVTVMTFSQASGKGSLLLAVQRDARVVRQIETDKDLGAPAVLDGLAFVPWGSEYVSVLDLSNGDEAARVTLREKVSRAWAEGGTLEFGELGVFRFDEHIKDASRRGATHLALPQRELIGTPIFMFAGTEPLPAVSDARDKVRLFARSTDAPGPIAVEGNVLYATYFRFIIGLGAIPTEPLAWVHTQAADVIGGAAAHGALVACDVAGKVTMIDQRSGGALGELDMGEPLKACTVNVDALRPTGTPPPAQALVDQLTHAVAATGPDMATAQRFFLRELAAQPDDAATAALVSLATDPKADAELHAAAGDALAARRNGGDSMLSSLDHPYDWLRDVMAPPPVGPVARALAASNDPRGAAPLARYLLDTSITDDDVRDVAAALAVLATPREKDALLEFFGMYRAATSRGALLDAVVSVAQALLRVSPDDARTLLGRAAADGMSPPDVAKRLAALLAPPDAAADGAGVTD
jgi:outer membrane protein assembly factor BamB